MCCYDINVYVDGLFGDFCFDMIQYRDKIKMTLLS